MIPGFKKMKSITEAVFLLTRNEFKPSYGGYIAVAQRPRSRSCLPKYRIMILKDRRHV